MNLVRNEKAVAPVVASLILVVITVGAFSILMSVTTQWLSLQRTNEMQTISERLIIEDVWFLPSPNNRIIRLTVTNVGKVGLKIHIITVNGSPLWEKTGGDMVSLEAGETATIDILLESKWIANTKYTIKIITERGNEFENIYTSPSS